MQLGFFSDSMAKIVFVRTNLAAWSGKNCGRFFVKGLRLEYGNFEFNLLWERECSGNF